MRGKGFKKQLRSEVRAECHVVGWRLLGFQILIGSVDFDASPPARKAGFKTSEIWKSHGIVCGHARDGYETLCSDTAHHWHNCRGRDDHC
jgi:hypothetical protein